MKSNQTELPPEFPGQDRDSVQEIVGASHSNYERVLEMVKARSALARASWDWGFGDWETALGAASHMGRKDIASILIENGASPDIFTHAMMGKYDLVVGEIEAFPGIQRNAGPHGITLMQHARMPLLRDFLSGEEKMQQEKLVEYLEALGDADIKATSLEMTEDEQKQYFGKYVFGSGPEDFFTIGLQEQMKKLFLSRGEMSGRMLHKTGDLTFAPSGAPHVRVKFDGDKQSLTILDPGPLVTALRTDG